MLDIEDEEDEEGEVDAELDADAGELNLLGCPYYMLNQHCRGK
jgi:hypothetical protein